MWTEYRSTVPAGPPDCGNGTGGAGGGGGGATGGAGGSSTGGTGGTGGVSATPTEDDGDCGCRLLGVPRRSGPVTALLLASLGLLAAGRRRRRP